MNWITRAVAMLLASLLMATLATAQDRYADFKMQELKTLRPDMKLVLLEGVSHTGTTGIQGRPELVTAIREFIAGQR